MVGRVWTTSGIFELKGCWTSAGSSPYAVAVVGGEQGHRVPIESSPLEEIPPLDGSPDVHHVVPDVAGAYPPCGSIKGSLGGVCIRQGRPVIKRGDLRKMRCRRTIVYHAASFLHVMASVHLVSVLGFICMDHVVQVSFVLLSHIR